MPPGDRLYGFNFQWLFNADRAPREPDLPALDFMADHDFRFVRIPIDYRLLLTGPAFDQYIESNWELVDRIVTACRERGLYCSLNLHRAPGYCINRNHLESFSLWTDAEAQEAFITMWTAWAKRYRDVPAEALEFNLVNEPPREGMDGFTRARHEKVIRDTIAAVRAVDPHRPITIDGIEGGNGPLPELADLAVCQSCRGYAPMAISHYGATWVAHLLTEAPPPQWPGLQWQGQRWDRDALATFYAPWKQLEAKGVPVHVGECGCYNQTPNDVALAWLKDLFATFQDLGWGYALWQFRGAFGISDHGRPGARIETVGDIPIDRDLLDLLCAHRH